MKRFVRQQTDGKSPATRNKLIRTLRAVFSTAVPDSLPVNPALKIEFAGEPERDMRTVELAELERLLAVANERGQAVLLLGTCCGLRREEIAPLRWEDVDFSRGLVQVRNSEWHTTKSGQQREALMPPALCSLLMTMWELTNCGDVRCVRIGAAVRYSPADLAAWIESKKSA